MLGEVSLEVTDEHISKILVIGDQHLEYTGRNQLLLVKTTKVKAKISVQLVAEDELGSGQLTSMRPRTHGR